MCRVAPPSVLPDISPSRGRSAGRTRSLQPQLFGVDLATSRSPPLEGEMPGRAEGGIPRHTLAVPNPHTL
ncbi:propionyl-coenzyme A carboxylase alpha polypeptide [Rhizobium sp. BG6]|nr:propionyl-coenzyme A carboxylase alpha polypeptide [Rhizobium sp. BG6]